MGERQNERSRREQTRDRREPSGSWRVKFWAPGTGNEAQGLYHVMCMCALIGNQSGRTRFMFLVLSRCHSMTRELAKASPCLLGRPNDKIIIHIYSFMNLCELNKIDLTMKTEEVTRLMQFCGSSLKFRFLRSGFVFRNIRTSNEAFCYFINLILYNHNTKCDVYFTVLFPCQEWNIFRNQLNQLWWDFDWYLFSSISKIVRDDRLAWQTFRPAGECVSICYELLRVF